MYALGDLIEAMDNYKGANIRAWEHGTNHEYWLRQQNNAQYRAAAAIQELLITVQDED